MKSIELKIKRTYYDNGQIRAEFFTFNDKHYNPDGPAVIYYRESGEVKNEEYFNISGHLTCYKKWQEDGRLTVEHYNNGVLHCEDGPAVLEWCYENKLLFQEFWIAGKQLTEEEFKKRTQPCDGKVVEIDGKKYKLTEV